MQMRSIIIFAFHSLPSIRYKLLLADEIIEHFDPIRVKIEDYLCNRDYLVAILKKGQAVASEQAEKTLQEVKQRVGINIL